MSNNNGSSNILHYEKFTSSTCDFNITGVPSTQGSIKCIPDSYARNNSYVEEEGIMAGKYPVLNWNKDVYADWLITNSASLNTQKNFGNIGIGMGFTSALAGILTGISAVASGGSLLPAYGLIGGGLAGIFSGGHQVQNALDQDYEHSLIPNSSVGLASGGDINFCGDSAGFFFYHYSIKREFAKMIDNYFDMYGYKVNSLEVPQLSTRTNWNYLKIIDPNIEGDNIPEKDINIYKQMLIQGITFWHNPNTFRDYSQSNGNS